METETARKPKGNGKVEQAASDLETIVARKEAETQPTPTAAPTGPAIFRAMPAIMKEVGHIEKSRENPQQHYKFRGIDEIYEAVQLVLAKHGVCVIPFVVGQAREERQSKGGGVLIYTILTIDHTFYAEDGSSVVARTVGEAMDSGDKSANKAMSAAMKYAIIEAFSIPTREAKDTEEASPEPLPRGAPPTPPPPPAQATPPLAPKWFETAAGKGKMQRLHIALGKLRLGEAEADSRELKGKAREEFVHPIKLAYLGWAAGRKGQLASSKDLTEAEADKAIAKADAGEFPS